MTSMIVDRSNEICCVPGQVGEKEGEGIQYLLRILADCDVLDLLLSWSSLVLHCEKYLQSLDLHRDYGFRLKQQVEE